MLLLTLLLELSLPLIGLGLLLLLHLGHAAKHLLDVLLLRLLLLAVLLWHKHVRLERAWLLSLLLLLKLLHLLHLHVCLLLLLLGCHATILSTKGPHGR